MIAKNVFTGIAYCTFTTNCKRTISEERLKDKSAVGMIDDKIQDYTDMNGVSYFFLTMAFLVFSLRNRVSNKRVRGE